MREILFRGKRADNGEWVYGYYCRFGWTGQEKSYIIPSYARACTQIEVDPATVGQYTGKEDIHHRKAFKGDRIMYKGVHHTAYGVIRFGDIPSNGGVETHTGCYVEWEDDGENKWSYWWRCDLGFWLSCPECTIIGTIHDKEGEGK